MILRILALVSLFSQTVQPLQLSETFSETLHIRPLKDGKLSTTFEFTTLLPDASPSPLDLHGSDQCEANGLCNNKRQLLIQA